MEHSFKRLTSKHLRTLELSQKWIYFKLIRNQLVFQWRYDLIFSKFKALYMWISLVRLNKVPINLHTLSILSDVLSLSKAQRNAWLRLGLSETTWRVRLLGSPALFRLVKSSQLTLGRFHTPFWCYPPIRANCSFVIVSGLQTVSWWVAHTHNKMKMYSPARIFMEKRCRGPLRISSMGFLSEDEWGSEGL